MSRLAGSGPAALTVLAIALFSAAPFVPREHAWVLLLAQGAIVAAGTRWRMASAVHAALFGGLVVLMLQIPGLPWPLPLALALAAQGIAAIRLRGLRPGFGWLRRGSLDRGTVAAIGATVAASALAFGVWFVVAEPDLPELRARLPVVPLWSLVAGGLLFAALNAALEESAWRGMLLTALDGSLGSGRTSLLVQAVSYVLWHTGGFPWGGFGAVPAGIYGLATGLLRRRSGGILAPWLAHLCGDAVVLSMFGAFG
jgi:membrane protease YdiL (CAAX protease family)